MIEISTWRGISDPINNLDSKVCMIISVILYCVLDMKGLTILTCQVKAAFTRAYQKNPPILPYAVNSGGTAKKRATQNEDYIEDEDDDDEEADDINFDKMIKVKSMNISVFYEKIS